MNSSFLSFETAGQQQAKELVQLIIRSKQAPQRSAAAVLLLLLESPARPFFGV